MNPGPLQLWLPEWGTHRPSLSLEGLPCWAGLRPPWAVWPGPGEQAACSAQRSPVGGAQQTGAEEASSSPDDYF